MIKKVWKYQIKDHTKDQELILPADAEVLHWARQGAYMCIWCLVNPDPETAVESRTFRIFGTDWEVEPKYTKHIGTILEGSLVWHLFEKE